MAETIGYPVAILMLLLGVAVMAVSMRSILRGSDPAGPEAADPAERRPTHRWAA